MICFVILALNHVEPLLGVEFGGVLFSGFSDLVSRHPLQVLDQLLEVA